MKKPQNAKAAAQPRKTKGAKKAAGKPRGRKGHQEKLEKEAEVAKAVAGAVDSDPKIAALFNRHLDKISPKKELVAERMKELNGLYKEAKADGFKRGQINTALLCRTGEGRAEFLEKMQDTARAVRWSGVKFAPGTQFDIFGQHKTPAAAKPKKGEEQEADITNLNYNHGWNTSLGDKPAKPPHPPGSDEYTSWMKGYHDHQATLKLKKAEPPADDKVVPIGKRRDMDDEAPVEEQMAS